MTYLFVSLVRFCRVRDVPLRCPPGARNARFGALCCVVCCLFSELVGLYGFLFVDGVVDAVWCLVALCGVCGLLCSGCGMGVWPV